MKRKVLSLAVAVIFIFTVFPQASFADHGKGKGMCMKCSGGKGAGWGLEEKFFYKAHFILDHEEELGLSDAQVKDVKELKINVKKMLLRQDAEIDILGLDIKAKLYEFPVDANAINALIDKKYDLKKEKKKQLVMAFAQLKNGLSQEQYDKMKELHKK